jgi:hypothetical protein
MELVVFGYQIVPGRDEPLAFAASLEECQRDALSERDELRRNDPDIEPLGPWRSIGLPWHGHIPMGCGLEREDLAARRHRLDRKLVGLVADRTPEVRSRPDMVIFTQKEARRSGPS